MNTKACIDQVESYEDIIRELRKFSKVITILIKPHVAHIQE